MMSRKLLLGGGFAVLVAAAAGYGLYRMGMERGASTAGVPPAASAA